MDIRKRSRRLVLVQIEQKKISYRSIVESVRDRRMQTDAVQGVAEYYAGTKSSIIEGFDAHVIASAEEALSRSVPDSESKIAEQMIDASLSPDQIRTEDQFDVRSIEHGILAVRLQFCDQFLAFVYSGVGNDPDFPIQG